MADEVADNFNRHFDFKKIYHEGEQIRLVPLTDIYYMNETQDGGTFRSGNKEVTALLFGIALLIVIVAAINFTNFSTSLTPLRIKSINTQKVLGSSDTLLRRSLLIEAALISFIAWLVSLVIVWGLDWAEALLLSRRFEFGLKSSDRFLVWHRSVGYRLAGGYLSCLLYNFFSSGLGAEGQLRVISFRA